MMKPEDYTQGDAFQAEKRTIFSTCWLPICAEGQVAAPGQFVSASVGGWGVFAVRGKDGIVRVLRNACRHQNMPVTNAPSGTCETFRCRFHGWTFDLAGKFVGAPPPVAPVSSDTNLQELASVVERGIVFFRMEGAAPEPVLPAIGAYAASVTTEIAGNWKIAAEELILAQPGLAWQWPLLAIEGTRVHQIVPHTFLRTRIVTHLFGEASALSFDELKKTCEERQASGAPAASNAAIDAFYTRMVETYGSS